MQPLNPQHPALHYLINHPVVVRAAKPGDDGSNTTSLSLSTVHSREELPVGRPAEPQPLMKLHCRAMHLLQGPNGVAPTQELFAV